MKYRMGIASSDGIVVNQHFGRAARFLIMDVNEHGESHLVEDRHVVPVCMGGIHDDQRLEDMTERLSDCQYLLVSRIGRGAENALERKHIGVFEVPGMIEDSIKKVLVYIEIQNLLYE